MKVLVSIKKCALKIYIFDQSTFIARQGYTNRFNEPNCLLETLATDSCKPGYSNMVKVLGVGVGALILGLLWVLCTVICVMLSKRESSTK